MFMSFILHTKSWTPLTRKTYWIQKSWAIQENWVWFSLTFMLQKSWWTLWNKFGVVRASKSNHTEGIVHQALVNKCINLQSELRHFKSWIVFDFDRSNRFLHLFKIRIVSVIIAVEIEQNFIQNSHQTPHAYWAHFAKKLQFLKIWQTSDGRFSNFSDYQSWQAPRLKIYFSKTYAPRKWQNWYKTLFGYQH